MTQSQRPGEVGGWGGGLFKDMRLGKKYVSMRTVNDIWLL